MRTTSRLILHRSLAAAACITLCASSACERAPDSNAEQPQTTDRTSATDTQHPPTTDWPIFRGDRALTGRAHGSLTGDLELKWTFATGGAIASSPVVHDGRIFVGSDDGYLYCINLEDGTEVWKFLSEDVVEAPPLYFDGVVYVGSSDFYFYAIDAATGELLWKHETDDTVLGGANVVELEGQPPRIVVGSYDARLYCFDAKSGEIAWMYETADRVNGTPAVIGERIIFGGCDSTLHEVFARDGTPSATVPLAEDCHIAASVAIAVDEGAAYFGHAASELVKVDIDTGEIVWTYLTARQPILSAPAIGDDVVVVGAGDRKLHCVNRYNGEPVWTYTTTRKVDGSPVIVDNTVVFGSGDGRVHVLDLKSGEAIWTYDLGRPVFSSPAIVDNTILIGCGDKNLYAFSGAS